MLKKKVALGISDFKRLLEENIYFVDKSMLINDFMEDGSAILVLPRPRRFGKTLNMSMLRYFVDNKESSKELFTELEIAKDVEFCNKHLNKHPLIYISLKDVKLESWEESYREVVSLVQLEYKRHNNVMKSLDDEEKKIYNNVLSSEAKEENIKKSLLNLTRYLEKHYGKKAIVLIDEYDATIHKAYVKGYYKKAISFFQMFYGSVFKDNGHLLKGLMTGILRVSKESLFSGLNNVKVVSILSEQYSQYFGFTEEETFKFVETYDLPTKGMKEWYNGYQIGDNKLYNPWSVINYIDNKGRLEAYWVNTSSNDLIYETVKKTDINIKRDLLKLLSGEKLRKNINENINFKYLESEEAFYSLMLFAGYLTIEGKGVQKYYNIKIPNMEVKEFFNDLLLNLSKTKKEIGRIIESIERKEWEEFAEILSRYFKESFSYYDVSEKSKEKEYHLILMGVMMAMVPEYKVKSNRESGEGRYDILLINREREEGVVFELKKAGSKEEIEKEALKAIEQIEDRGYGREVKNITKVGIAFYGRDLKVVWK